MLKNITQRVRKVNISYEISFIRKDGCSGCGFPCDKDGNLLPMHPDAKRNYDYCMAHPEEYPVAWNEKLTIRQPYTEPAHGECICGRTVTLEDHYYGACCCDCGRWYNIYGQELLPPDQWETDPSEEDYYAEDWN